MKKKILMINAADIKGGAALHSKDLLLGLKQNGYAAKMLVGYKYSNIEDIDEIKRSFWKNIRFKGRGLDLYFRALRSFILSNDIGLFNKKDLLNHPWYKEADIIHFHNLHNYFFNLYSLPEISRQKKILWTLHDMWSVTGHCSFSINCTRWKKGCGKCPMKMAYPPIFIDTTRNICSRKEKIYSRTEMQIITPSKWLQNVAQTGILREKRNYHIPYGINTDVFRQIDGKTTVRKKLTLPADQKIVCFCANHGLKNKQKGGEYTLELVKRNPEVLFLLIGGRKKIDFRNIKQIPYISNPDTLAQYFNASDALLLPSVAENYPFIVLEAMSCGLPVVGFNCGGVAEQIKHKTNGYLARFANTDDLNAGLRYILSLNEDDYQRHSQDAVQTGSVHTMERHISQYLEIYNSFE